MGDTYFDTCARLILEPYKLLEAIDEWLDIAERIAEYDDGVVLMDWQLRDELAAMERLNELGAAIALAIDLESKGMDSSPLFRFREHFWQLGAMIDTHVNSENIDHELSVSVHFDQAFDSSTQQERLDLFLEAYSTLRRFWDVVLYRVTISDDWPTHPPTATGDTTEASDALAAKVEAKAKVEALQRGGQNDERDEWLYRERKKGTSVKSLVDQLDPEKLKSSHPDWEPICSAAGVTNAVRRHCIRRKYTWPIPKLRTATAEGR